MKRPGIDGGFFLCLVLNLLLNITWTIPAWLLLAAHFVYGISLWWFAGALLVWLLWQLGVTVFLSAVNHLGQNVNTSSLTEEEQRAKDLEIRERSANIRE